MNDNVSTYEYEIHFIYQPMFCIIEYAPLYFILHSFLPFFVRYIDDFRKSFISKMNATETFLLQCHAEKIGLLSLLILQVSFIGKIQVSNNTNITRSFLVSSPKIDIHTTGHHKIPLNDQNT